jgi:hypothetical protein
MTAQDAQTPPAKVLERGACGPKFAHLFVTKLDDEGRPVEYLDVARLLQSKSADSQRYAIKVVCERACTVRSTCLRWAVETRQQHGAWGGKTTRQLRKLQRDEDTAAAAPAPVSEQAEAPPGAVAAPSAA